MTDGRIFRGRAVRRAGAVAHFDDGLILVPPVTRRVVIAILLTLGMALGWGVVLGVDRMDSGGAVLPSLAGPDR